MVPAGHSLLAVAAHLAKTILSDGLAHARFFQMAIFLANPPANIESRQIARRERTHGHAELDQRVVNRLYLRAFFDQKLCFAAIGPEHAVSDEAPAVSHEHANLAEFLRELHASGDDFFTCLFPTHNFEQAHDVGRAEKVSSDHGFGPRGDIGNLVDAQCRCIARQNRAGLAGAIQILKHLLS